MKCILCQRKIKGRGNNTRPLAKGQCCDLCNNKVIEFRIKLSQQRRGEKDE